VTASSARRMARTRPPPLGPAPTMRLPEPVRTRLGGGLRVALVERRSVPVVNVQLLVLGGAAAVRPTQAGLATFTADMIDEGAGERNALEIAAAFDLLGAAHYSSAGFDASEVELNVLTPRLPQALEVLGDVVLSPTFPEAELERVRHERMTRALQEVDDPRALATHALARVLFGDGHPWGRPLLGTRDSLSGLSVADVRRFYQERYHPGCATLLVVGDFESNAMLTLLDQAFGSWEARPVPAVEVPDPPAVEGTSVYVVDRPGSAQSEIRVGRVAVSRSTGDYFPITVMNTVLGGSFTSRLNQRLREEKGYTYGAGCGFSMRRGPGPFVAQAAVHTPVTAEAVADFLGEIGRMAAEEVTPDELERARRYVALRLPQRFETVADVTARLAEMALYDLPDDYFDVYVERVLAVTAAEVLEAAGRHLDVERMVVVVAGDRAAVEEPLIRLGIGPVEVLAAPEAPGDAPLPGGPARTPRC